MRLGSLSLRFLLRANVPNLAFSSTSSLLDFDVIVYDPANALSEYLDSNNSTHNGSRYLSSVTDDQLARDAGRRNREFEELFPSGGLLWCLFQLP